jgi:hypothetical protein
MAASEGSAISAFAAAAPLMIGIPIRRRLQEPQGNWRSRRHVITGSFGNTS